MVMLAGMLFVPRDW